MFVSSRLLLGFPSHPTRPSREGKVDEQGKQESNEVKRSLGVNAATHLFFSLLSCISVFDRRIQHSPVQTAARAEEHSLFGEYVMV